VPKGGISISNMNEEAPFERRWEIIDASENDYCYSPRTGHTVVEYDGSFYLFGGTDKKRRQQDLYKFDTRKRSWEKLYATGHLPTRRSGALGAVLDGSLYIFGGYDGRDGNYFNDLYRLDFATLEWSLVRHRNRTLMDILDEEPEMLDEDLLATREDIPQPRTDHCMVAYDHRLFVFGGYDGSERFNNTFEFDLRTLKWRELCKKQGQAANSSFNKNPDSSTTPLQPSRRFGHSGVVYDGKLWIFGGWDGRETLDCIFALDLHTERWMTLPMLRAEHRQRAARRLVQQSRRAEPFVGSKRRYSLVGQVEKLQDEQDAHLMDSENLSRSSNRQRRALWDGVCRTFTAHASSPSSSSSSSSSPSPENATASVPSNSAASSSAPSLSSRARPFNQASMLLDGIYGRPKTGAGVGHMVLSLGRPNRSASVMSMDYSEHDSQVEDERYFDEQKQREDFSRGIVSNVSVPGSDASTGFEDEEERKDDDIMDVDVTFANSLSLENCERTSQEAWPHNRYRHSAVLCGDSMVVFGGVDKKHNRFNDVYQFKFDTLEWEAVQIHGVEPSSRTFHRAVCDTNYMYILGGYDGDDRLNDMHRVYLGPLTPAPLSELCASLIRKNVASMSGNGGVFEYIAPMVLDTVIWTRDSRGLLRGGRVDHGKQVCSRFVKKRRVAPSSSIFNRNMNQDGVEDDDEFQISTNMLIKCFESDICSSCNGLAILHDLIKEDELYIQDSDWQPDTEISAMQDMREESDSSRQARSGKSAQSRYRNSSADSTEEEEEEEKVCSSISSSTHGSPNQMSGSSPATHRSSSPSFDRVNIFNKPRRLLRNFARFRVPTDRDARHHSSNSSSNNQNHS